MGLKSLSVGRSDLFQFRPQDIKVQEGFNARDFSKPEVVEHIESLAAKIKAQGFDYSKPIKIKLIDDVAYVRDGECRLRAILKLIGEGLDIPSIPVVAVKNTSNVDDLIEQANANDGKKFDAFEEADLFKRLLSFGISVDAMAAKVGKTSSYVTERLALGGADYEVRELVRDGALAVTAAREVVRLPQEKKRDIVRSAKKAKAEGKKVTLRQTQIQGRGHAATLSYSAVQRLLEELRGRLSANTKDARLKHQIEGVEMVLQLARGDKYLTN